MPDEWLTRLRRFHAETFPAQRERFEDLVAHGQHPTNLFIGCSDSRIIPYLLTGAGTGELFMVRNAGAFVPPCDGYLEGSDVADLHAQPLARSGPQGPGTRAEDGRAAGVGRRWVGYHGTVATIEFAVRPLGVARIVVCGHSHCGAIQALYGPLPAGANNLAAWLELGREAVLPVAEPGPEALRRTEQRAVVLQLERLMAYPMVRARVEARALTLHGWHYVLEEGEVHVFDVRTGRFVAASQSEHSGTGPYAAYDEPRRRTQSVAARLSRNRHAGRRQAAAGHGTRARRDFMMKWTRPRFRACWRRPAMTNRKLDLIVGHQDPLVLPAADSVRHACQCMWARRVGAVLVTDERQQLAGIFTGRDAVHVLAEGRDPSATRLAEAMTPGPETIAPGSTAIEALRRMSDGGFRHLPVLDQGRIVGIVSRNDFEGLELDRLETETRLWERIG